MGRPALLNDAKKSADQHWSGRLLQGLLILAFAAYLGLAWADRPGASTVFGWTVVVCLLGWQLQRQILMPRYFRVFSAR